jgi:plasmid stabilization system protein ParE
VQCGKKPGERRELLEKYIPRTVSDRVENEIRQQPAVAEFLEAVACYGREDAAVSRAFLEEVERAIAQILEHPAASPVLHPEGIRRKVLNRFPYGLYYLSENEQIRIVAVGHHKRRPGYWMRRLRRP